MTREMKELRSKKWEVQLCILPTWELNFLCNYFSVPRNLRYGYLEEGRGEWVGGSELLGATIGLAKKTRSDWLPDCQKWTWRNFYLHLLWAWLATQCVSRCCSGFTRCSKKKKKKAGPRKMAQQVKLLASNTDNLSLFPASHGVKGKNRLTQLYFNLHTWAVT